MRSNPGSTFQFKEPKGVFAGMYMCLAGLRDGFKSGLRHLICLDGCWLKGEYGGHLLAAIGIDPNDCIYPIAWVVVHNECTETWTWFFELLKNDLEMWNSHDWCFMSDRQKVWLIILFQLPNFLNILRLIFVWWPFLITGPY